MRAGSRTRGHGGPAAAYGRAVVVRAPLLVALATLTAMLAPGIPTHASAGEGQARSPTLTPPVPGPVVTPFEYGPDPFARGQHRGVDLAARPGEEVRAACRGRVVAAGEVAGRGVVSIECGVHRVSHMPLARIGVEPGRTVEAGDPIGAVGPGHRGLHLGVRRSGDPFGYVDPGPLMAVTALPPSVLPVRGERRIRPPGAAPPRPVPRPIRAGVPRPRPAAAPVTAHAPAAAPARGPTAASGPTTAPWPLWAGLALITGGLVRGAWHARRFRAKGGRAWAHARR